METDDGLCMHKRCFWGLWAILVFSFWDGMHCWSRGLCTNLGELCKMEGWMQDAGEFFFTL